MYKEKLIVLNEKDINLKAWGVNAVPFYNNDNWLLPLGWEEELTKANIEFKVKKVELINELE